MMSNFAIAQERVRSHSLSEIPNKPKDRLSVKNLPLNEGSLTTNTAVFVPKIINTWTMLKDDFFCCFNNKYIQVRKDGLCLFRCILAIKYHDETYTKQPKSADIKRIVLTEFKEIIDDALNHAFEVSNVCHIFKLPQAEIVPSLKDSLHALWDAKWLLGKFGSLAKIKTMENRRCGSGSFSQEEKEAAKLFSNVFFGHLVSNFAQASIVKWGYHYLLHRESFEKSTFKEYQSPSISTLSSKIKSQTM